MSQQPSNLILSNVNLSKTILIFAQELDELSTCLHEVLQGVTHIELRMRSINELLLQVTLLS